MALGVSAHAWGRGALGSAPDGTSPRSFSLRMRLLSPRSRIICGREGVLRGARLGRESIGSNS